MIYFGLFLSSVTELLERLFNFGAFYMSPARLFILVIAYMTFLAWCIANQPARVGRYAKLYAASVVVLLVMTAISVRYSTDIFYSAKRTLNATSIYLLPLIIYFYLSTVSKKYPKETLINMLGVTIVYCGILVSLFGYIQEATGFLRTLSEVRLVFGVPVYRINSLFQDPNFLAYFLIFPWWICMAGGAEITGINSSFFRRMSAGMIFVSILMTGSRGGLLMAGAAIFSYFLYKLFKRRPSVCFYIEAIVVVVAPIVILAYSYFQFERIVANASSFDTGGESGLSRVLSWYSGLMLYLDHPIFGVGPGNFVTLHKGIYLPYNYVHPWVADNISTLAGHSNVLETLVESGPFTLAAYFGMQLVVYGALFYGSVKNQDGRYAMFRTLYFCAAIGNIFISYYPIFLMYIIGILLFSIDRDIIGFAQRKIVTFATEFKSSVPSATRYRES